MSDSCLGVGLLKNSTSITHANSGDESLSLAKINELVDVAFAVDADGVPDKIVHQGCRNWFRKHTPKAMEPNPISVFYGLPIYSDPRVPFGEFWVLDSKDNVIRRFKTI